MMEMNDLEKFTKLIDHLQEKFDGAEVKSDYKIKIKIKNVSNNPIPEYATEGSSGFDFRANLPDGPVVIDTGIWVTIPSGLYFELPTGYEIQIRPRSGLAAKHGISVLNTPGTIDSDYRGEVKVILINHGPTFTINHGDRIAQGVISAIWAKSIFNLVQVDQISNDTTRGEAGFMHTGLK